MAVNYKKRRGDRKEGRLLRSLDPFYTFTPFIMKTRNDSSNLFMDKVEISVAEDYLRAQRAAGYKGIGMLHLFLAGYVRTVSQYPAINRYVAGQRIYARDTIECVMTVKKRLSVDSGETTFRVCFLPTDTVFDIYRKMNVEIEKIKADEENNSTEKVAQVFSKFPRFVFRAAIRLITWLDYHGWLPRSLVAASPFHGSIVVTDIGSLGIPVIYHHLYNFGDCPLFLAFGAKRRELEAQKDGIVGERRYIDFTVTSDERICDGHYYSVAFRNLKYLLRNPQILGTPPETVVEDVQ